MVWVGGVSCALLMGVLRVALRGSLGSRPDAAGCCFFGVSATLSLAGVLAVPVLNAAAVEDDAAGAGEEEEEEVVVNGKEGGHGGGDPEQVRLVPLELPAAGDPPTAVRVLRRHPAFYAVMCLDFVYMMSLYPGVLSVLHGLDKTDSAFTDFLFLAFNAGDFVGKMLPMVLTISSPRRVLALLAGEVAVFAPLVVVAAAVPAMHSPALAYVLAALMAMTHGLATVSSYNAVAEREAAARSAGPVRRLAGGLNFIASFVGVGLGTCVAVGLRYSPLVVGNSDSGN